MQDLSQKIINQNEDIKKLYKMAVLDKDPQIYGVFKERFRSSLFKIHATSYLHKSITLNAREIKRKDLRLYNRESLTLNKLDSGFNEESIYSIPDKSVDFIEEITSSKHIDFTEIFRDQELAIAVSKLTEKQKTIIYLKFVKEYKEKEIALKLGISIQAVNKGKNSALKLLKSS